ncbi:MAG: DUF1738 domain-containing protein [Desulfobacteraceae bacterium]|nr:DUF1738 domain-containing protein [Desulfobacteraceae bacterium]
MELFFHTHAKKTIDLLTSSKRKSLSPATTLPYNPVTGTVYSGINSFVLSQYMLNNGTNDARFCKWNQVHKFGEKTHILKGEKGTHILEPKTFELPPPGITNKELKDQGISAEEQNAIFEGLPDGKIVFFRPISVFHASQINNAPALEIVHETMDWQISELVETLVDTCGIKVTFGAKNPIYALGSDTIHMPAKRTFKSPEDYAAQLLRQWYTATGAKIREERFKGPSQIGEGILNQAAEELRAETFSLVASQTLGLPYKPTTQKIYVNCWEKQLAEDPKHIVKTAHATRLINTVVNFSQGIQPKADWFPDKSTWPKVFSSSDLDAHLDTDHDDNERVSKIHAIMATLDTNFAFTKGEDDKILFSSDMHMDKETGQSGEKDVLEAFRIQEILQDKIENLNIDVEEHNGKIILSIDLSHDLDTENTPGL